MGQPFLLFKCKLVRVYIIDSVSLGRWSVKIIDVYQEFLRDVTELILTFN